MNQFPYGAVLKVQREYTLTDIFDRMQAMKELGMNIVVIWPAVYWWEDKSLPDYPYHTGHEILKFAEKIGMKVIMELAGQLTSLEYAPDFLMRDKYYSKTFDGRNDIWEWVYGYINYNHPEVKSLIRKIFSGAVKNYKDYSSLYGYDIWNETMFSSYDEYTLELFRKFLKNKYGTIEELNRVWDRTYFDWSQIKFTKWLWASVMPFVDYNQFKKENIGLILKEWSEIVKAIDPKHPVIADNIHSMVTQNDAYHRPQDDWNVASNVDEFGLSFYPCNKEPGFPPNVRWEIFSAIRSSAPNKKFWVSEMQSHQQSMFNPFGVVDPYKVKLWSWESISQGAKGIVYWMWEPFIKGIQTSGRGLVDYGGNYTKRAFEAKAIKEIINEHNEEFCSYAPPKAKAAIFYDKLNQDFIKAYTEAYERSISSTIYTDSICGLYKCLWKQNVAADFITPDELLEGSALDYKVIFMTSQVNISPQLSDAIKKYVMAGGTLIIDGKFGMIDNYGILHKSVPGGDLNKYLGIRITDIDYRDLTITEQSKDGQRRIIDGYHERQILDVWSSEQEILGRFSDSSPAVISSVLGQGRIIYFATFLWYGYFKEGYNSVEKYISSLCDDLNLRKFEIGSEAVKVCSLEGSSGMLVFAFNYSEADIQVDIKIKDVHGEKCSVKNLYTSESDILSAKGRELNLSATVKSKDVSVFKVTYLTEN